jgi:hypothetical protein
MAAMQQQRDRQAISGVLSFEISESCHQGVQAFSWGEQRVAWLNGCSITASAVEIKCMEVL